jgi:ATP-dependent exoDNAse (exonuclease V) alpha subunit
MTGADRSWAQRYEIDDILRYSRASKETGIGKGEYARVVAIHARGNMLTVLRRNGEQTTYDPRRQMGVSVYRAQEKVFSIGDRIQFTAPNQELKIANRELGKVESIASDGTMRLKLDGGRSVELTAQGFPHMDHGYAITSYSSQGQTAERVLIHADTELGAKDLLNNRMAYVSVSRGQWDAQIFTNDREKLSQALSHDVSHQSAYKPEQAITSMQQKIAPSPAHGPELGIGLGLGM